MPALNGSLSPAHPGEYVKTLKYPVAWVNEEAFAALKIKEEEAERDVGEAMKQIGMRGYYTRWQLAQGAVPNTEIGRKYLHSYSPHGGWYVMGVPAPYTVGIPNGADHGSPYTYDTHVPLIFYGLPFQSGTYRTHAEPVDLAVTLASLLGINAPTHAIGRVLTEALAPLRRASGGPQRRNPRPPAPTTQICGSRSLAFGLRTPSSPPAELLDTGSSSKTSFTSIASEASSS